MLHAKCDGGTGSLSSDSFVSPRQAPKLQSMSECEAVRVCYYNPGAHRLVFTCCVLCYVIVFCYRQFFEGFLSIMAVPFALPEDEINNLIVAVIFILSQTRLQRTEETRELQGKFDGVSFAWDGTFRW